MIAQDIISRRSETPGWTYMKGMERLVSVVQELSMARDIEKVMRIVRRAAREISGADGATFVLRDHDMSYYADEDAIAPLWKGMKFPIDSCISGWAMLNRAPAVIEDIYVDDRIPLDLYRPTFVKSLVMVPIRTADPIGAIGNYWAVKRKPAEEEVRLLQALADTTAVAIENVRVYNELEQRVRQRTQQLEEANQELEAFSYSVSHDLRAPLRHVDGFVDLLRKNSESALDENGRRYLDRISGAAKTMGTLIDELLVFSRMGRSEMRSTVVPVGRMVDEVISSLVPETSGRQIVWLVDELPEAEADPSMLRLVFMNLLSNAVKYTSKVERAEIHVGCTKGEGDLIFIVSDNGAGFDMKYADKLFGVFQRLHRQEDFEGVGIGLANVRRIVHRHGGRTWAEGTVNGGATFYFSLPSKGEA